MDSQLARSPAPGIPVRFAIVFQQAHKLRGLELFRGSSNSSSHSPFVQQSVVDQLGCTCSHITQQRLSRTDQSARSKPEQGVSQNQSWPMALPIGDVIGLGSCRQARTTILIIIDRSIDGFFNSTQHLMN